MTALPQTRSAGSLTLGLIGLNCLIFLLMCFGGVPVLDPAPIHLVTWGALFGPITVGHQWWRIGSSMFLHVGLVHLVMNMVCLFSLGLVMDVFYGGRVFLLTYVLSGLGGSLMSLLVHPIDVGAGASGAIFGVAGALLSSSIAYGHTEAAKPLGIKKGSLTSFLFMNLLYGLFQPGIDIAAHIGGLVTGALVGLVLLTPSAIGGGASRTRLVLVAAAASAALVFCGAGLQQMNGLPEAQYNHVLLEIAQAQKAEREDSSTRHVANEAQEEIKDRVH